VPVELVFDRGIGDIFVVRVAGNILGISELASVEFAVEHLGTPVFVVLGHTKCGTVTAVLEYGMLGGNLRTLSEKILPVVEECKDCNPGITTDRLVNEIVKANVWQVIQDALRSSRRIRERIRYGGVKAVGGVYDIGTGKVEWMGTHHDQRKLLEWIEKG